MLKKMITCVTILGLGLGLLIMAGCESDAQTDGLIGAGIGAGLGQAIGGDTEATMIGAGVGAAGGYMVGSESDKKKTRQEAAAVSEAQNYVTLWITNTNGSKTPVQLRKDGYGGYIGPRGEHYNNLPTEAQLQQLYGM